MAPRPGTQSLPEDVERRAVALLREWRLAPRRGYACPSCGADGLIIEDRSARPHMEWYQLNCAACGLDHALNIPLGSTPPSLD